METIIEDENICCSAIQLVMADRCLQTGYSWHDDTGQRLFVYRHFDGHVGTCESCLVCQLDIWSNGRIASRVREDGSYWTEDLENIGKDHDDEELDITELISGMQNDLIAYYLQDQTSRKMELLQSKNPKFS